MPLGFGKKKKQQQQTGPGGLDSAFAATERGGQPGADWNGGGGYQAEHPSATQHQYHRQAAQHHHPAQHQAHALDQGSRAQKPARLPKGSVDPVPAGAHRYAPSLSLKTFDVGGLPVNVFGLDELTPVPSRSSASRPPEVCVIFHLHGRGSSAKTAEGFVRQFYHTISLHRNMDEGRAALPQSGRNRQGATRSHFTQDGSNGQGQQGVREYIFVSFDARNHGHRLTHEQGQKSWKDQNPEHAKDLYAMVIGTARDVSFLIDFLPSYLFPHDERIVTCWTCTGRSLGGHSAWAVLTAEPRITVGVPFIGCADFQKLLQDRARTSFVPYGPPTVPHSLQALMKTIDPAANPYYSSFDQRNPFWNKRICVCSGAADKLVKHSYSEEFLRNLVVGEPNQGRGDEGTGTGFAGLKIYVEPNCGHTVTDAMVDVASAFIYRWAIRGF